MSASKRLTSLDSRGWMLFTPDVLFVSSSHPPFPKRFREAKKCRRRAGRLRRDGILGQLHGPQLLGQEVERRPWPTDHHLAVLELLGSGVEAALILHNGVVLNQVGDADGQTARTINPARDFLFKRVEELMYLL